MWKSCKHAQVAFRMRSRGMLAVLCAELVGGYHKRTVTGMTGVQKNLVVWNTTAGVEEEKNKFLRAEIPRGVGGGAHLRAP